MEEKDAHYWASKLRQDSQRLDEGRKRKLIRALLVYGIPLSEEDADLFIDLQPKTTDTTLILRYCEIERKVAEAYSTRERLFTSPKLERDFLKEFRTILDGFYTREELHQLTSIMEVDEGTIAVMWLVGANHRIYRRVRNAYLLEITDLISIGEDDVARDETHTLFDGSGDAVSQIDKLLGKDKQD